MSVDNLFNYWTFLSNVHQQKPFELETIRMQLGHTQLILVVSIRCLLGKVLKIVKETSTSVIQWINLPSPNGLGKLIHWETSASVFNSFLVMI